MNDALSETIGRVKGMSLGQIWDKSLGTGLGAKSRRISEPR
jgi:hypothetical protein